MEMSVMGELIQMNAHMVVTKEARAMIIFGAILAFSCAVCAVATLLSSRKKHRRRYLAIFAAFMAVGIWITIAGTNQPRQKVIMACAHGPISLEQVAAVYTIKEVDGKMLTLIER